MISQNLHILIVLVLALDLTWIFMMKGMYKTLIYHVQHKDMTIRILPAALSYLCIVIGIVFYCVPSIKEKLYIESSPNSILQIMKWSFVYGGGFGLVTYGIFNFTNMAMFSDYYPVAGLVDILWGVSLCTLSMFIYFTVLIR